MDIELYKPTVLDIEKMQELVAEDVKNGNILDRNANEMATTIRSYTVARYKDQIVGFVCTSCPYHHPLRDQKPDRKKRVQGKRGRKKTDPKLDQRGKRPAA